MLNITLDLHKPEDYRSKVLDYVKKYATEEALNGKGENGAGDGMDDDESSMSEYSDEDDADLNMEM